MKEITLETLVDRLIMKPGLVVGPNVTLASGEWRQIQETGRTKAREYIDIAGNENLDFLIDSLRIVSEKGAEEVINQIIEAIKISPDPLEIGQLVKSGWSSIISLTPDLKFESSFKNYQDTIPSSKTATLVCSDDIVLPSRTIPIYKLLGSLLELDEDKRLVLSDADVQLRKQKWGSILRTLSDYVMGAPLLFVGTESISSHVQTLLSVLATLPPPSCRNLIFIKSDATYANQTIVGLLSKFNVEICDAELPDIANAIYDLKSKQLSLNIGYNTEQVPLENRLEKYSNLVSLVPASLKSPIDIALHRNILLDALFRPLATDWAPFLVKMDLRRTVTDEIVSKIENAVEENLTINDHFFVRGEAGVGKTTVLKRAAIELANVGFTVLWIRKTGNGLSNKTYRDLAFDINEHMEKSKCEKRIVVFCDNPAGIGISPEVFADLFNAIKNPITFVFSHRNSDYFGEQITETSHDKQISRANKDIEVPFVLDETEILALPSMLVTLGMAATVENAKLQVQAVHERKAKDILCSLWFLIPETQSQIAHSLQDEYLKLGDISNTVSATAQGIATSSEIAQRAYEAVTVTSNLDIGLPIEVLVRFLKVEYIDWLDISTEGKPIWGLLYADVDDQGTSTFYRTRNVVVTQVLLGLVNTGTVGHSGEARIIRELVSACEVGTPVYRDFITSILVSSSKKIRDIFSYEEGIKLFDLARKVLPFEDRILELHKGRWMQSNKQQLASAYKQYEVALNCDEYPGADRHAPAAHVHTSMAATVLQMIKVGDQEKESGQLLIKRHIDQASNRRFFDAHTMHVSANLFFELAMQGDSDDKVSFESLSKALAIIESALQKIGSPGRSRYAFSKHVMLLTKLRTDILESYDNLESLKEIALEIFESSGSTAGFEVASRVLLASAIESDKGKDYKKVDEYIRKCIRCIENAGNNESILELQVVRIDLIIRWHLQKSSGDVDWEALRLDAQAVVQKDNYKNDPLISFYLAIAHFHIGDTTNANALFSQLRVSKIPGLDYSAVRHWHVGERGKPKRNQCLLKKSQGRTYAVFSDLSLDIPVYGNIPRSGAGATEHAYIGFSLNGLTAVFDGPGSTEYLLP